LSRAGWERFALLAHPERDNRPAPRRPYGIVTRRRALSEVSNNAKTACFDTSSAPLSEPTFDRAPTCAPRAWRSCSWCCGPCGRCGGCGRAQHWPKQRRQAHLRLAPRIPDPPVVRDKVVQPHTEELRGEQQRLQRGRAADRDRLRVDAFERNGAASFEGVDLHRKPHSDPTGATLPAGIHEHHTLLGDPHLPRRSHLLHNPTRSHGHGRHTRSVDRRRRPSAR